MKRLQKGIRLEPAAARVDSNGSEFASPVASSDTAAGHMGPRLLVPGRSRLRRSEEQLASSQPNHRTLSNAGFNVAKHERFLE